MSSDAPSYEEYVSPLVSRWSSPAMSALFSDCHRFRVWRGLWLALAESEKELGLDIRDEQLEELRRTRDEVNIDVARELEKEVRHDVMAHVQAWGRQCPKARGVIHLGATSCYVTDNAELILMREALTGLRGVLVNLIDALGSFAAEWRDQPCLGSTHFQPAQVTTVGKRACLWLHDFVMDLDDLEHRLDNLAFRGVKGTTGTQASFLRLFDGDHEKVEKLDAMVASKMGFAERMPVTGQTYPRKIDSRILDVLAGVAQSAHKFANDVRLLQGVGELEEPFRKTQIGSSAMPWKRNPMRSERMTGLARFVICTAKNAHLTAAEQWLERTLDDSSNRRLSIPESFLATDAILQIARNVASGLVVYPAVIKRRMAEQLPFMASESILMDAVRAGGDRQALHEKIRRHAMDAAARMKEEGASCDLLERIAADPAFAGMKDRLPELARPEAFVGRAPQQVDAFLDAVVTPVRRRHADLLEGASDLRV